MHWETQCEDGVNALALSGHRAGLRKQKGHG